MMRKFKLVASKLLFELSVVFVGVFLAFLLANWNNKRADKDRKAEIYTAICEDLLRFQQSGDDSIQGFRKILKLSSEKFDSTIARREPLKPSVFLYGDYWEIEIIESFVTSGVIREVDIATLKELTRFRSAHHIFVQSISDFNRHYEELVTLNYVNGIDEFYEPDKNQLKSKYAILSQDLKRTARMAEILVPLAKEIESQIRKSNLTSN